MLTFAKMASLSIENMKNFYHCEKNEKRRDLLAMLLGFPNVKDEEEDMRASILLDFYLESLNFALSRGFSWQQGLVSFELIKELLEKTVDLPLVEATECFKTLVKDRAAVFLPDQITSVVDFVFSLFFSHFRLYKFVFKNEREVNGMTYHLIIESPPQNIKPLNEGIKENEWKHQQILKNLELQHNKNHMDRQSLVESEIQMLESLVNDKVASLSDDSLSTDEIKVVIQDTVKMYVASCGRSIRCSIEASQENLEYQHAKAAASQLNQPDVTGISCPPTQTSVKKSASRTKSSKA